VALQAGKLDRRVVLQRRTASPGPTGQPLETWAEIGPAWARVEWVSGTERQQTDQRTAAHEVTFEIRYRPGLSAATTRVMFDGDVFEVLSIGEGKRRESLLLSCRAHQPVTGP